MIFVTLGSSKVAPMYDLAKKVDEVASRITDEILIQYGITDMEFHHAKGVAYLTSDEMQDALTRADIVISHGGWGTLSQCITMGKRLIAVARKQGIEVNHDQLQLVKKLESLGCLLSLDKLDDMETVIEKARTFKFQPLKRGNALPIIEEYLARWNV